MLQPLKAKIGTKRIGAKVVLQSLFNVIVLVLAVAGLAKILDLAIGDGELPRFQSLKQVAPVLCLAVNQNSTEHLNKQSTPDQIWESLQPTVQLVEAVAPEIAQWVRELQQQGQLEYRLLPLQKYVLPWEVTASYNANWDVLNIGPGFWELSDGNKAAFLIHEYRHYRQNRAKLITNLVAKVASGKLREYGSVLEDEAYLYQLDAYRALGIPYTPIREYLLKRHLLNYEDPNQNTACSGIIP